MHPTVPCAGHAAIAIANHECGVQVYKGNLGGFCPVAIKVVDSKDSQQQKRFVHEIATLRACHSPNIIMFLGAIIQEGSTVLVMQYMPNGESCCVCPH